MPDLAQRRDPLDRHPVISQRSKITIAAAPPRTRYVLRGSEAVATAVGTAFGLALPMTLNTASVDGDKAAFRLGPDEWLLLGGTVGTVSTTEAYSLVEVSNRNTAITVSGSVAADVLNAHVMLDLDPAAFPVGMATRTLFTKAEIVLWRTGPSAFHIEVWRSFAEYVFGLLGEAAREYVK
jgi:sarcosine oxidase subunit gamma